MIELIINYYMVKKQIPVDKTYRFKSDGIGVYAANIGQVKIKLIKGFKIFPEELKTMSFLLKLLHFKNGGQGVYKICPLYRKKRGVHRPIMGIKLFQTSAEIYLPVPNEFEEWKKNRVINLTN